MLQISQYPNILNQSECDFIINLASDKMKKAMVVGDGAPNDYRTAEMCWLDDDGVGILDKVKQQVSYYSGLPIENQERPHFVKYGIGGKYDAHFDYFDPTYEPQKIHIDFSGNRAHSFLIYLNENFKGGETHFDIVDITIKPKIGMGLMWNNTIDEYLIEESSHAGLPVIEGTKWILIIWIRQYSTIPPNKSIL